MNDNVIFEWHGAAFSQDERNADWYWALGIISTAAVIAAILFGNIILALVIVAASGALAVQAAKKPQIHRFRVTDVGVGIDEHFFFFSHMISFTVLEYVDPKIPPTLHIKTTYILSPQIVIPIIGENPEAVYDYILNHLPHDERPHGFVDRIASALKI